MSNCLVLVGAFGSGKTEVAINLALAWASEQDKRPVSLVDLDLVTPFFRSREHRQKLTDHGVRVTYPASFHSGVELPVMPPGVREAIAGPGTVILDVGGDGVGARMLGSLADLLGKDARRVMVVNTYRPLTRDVDGAVGAARSISAASGVEIGELLANPYLGEDTSWRGVYSGYETVRRAARLLGVRTWGLAVWRELWLAWDEEEKGLLMEKVDEDNGCLVSITRHLLPPWQLT